MKTKSRRPLVSHIPVMVCVIAAASLAANAASLSFSPTYDFGTLDAGQQAQFQATIESALSYYSASFGAPFATNVEILFKSDESVGLGQSSTLYDNVSYTNYRAALVMSNTSANDLTAQSFMTAGTNNPVNGTPTVTASLPLLRALGLGGTLGLGEIDSTISLKTSEMSLDRAGAVNPSKYDLYQVALHEINEVLGLTSALTGAGSFPYNPPGGNIGPIDLFRYSAAGVRSYTQDPNAVSYLSIDGGTTNLAGFNQDHTGDFGDYDGAGPMVQDAFSSPGFRLDNGLAETTSLDVVGYSVIPEPSSTMLLAGAFILLGVRRRTARA